MQIKWDRDECISNGMCCAVAPKYFELDEAGGLVVLRAEVDEADHEVVQDAAGSCPVGAIILVDAAQNGTSTEES
jgi:ferredoxin